MIDKLFVGDVTVDLANFAQEKEPDAFLITDSNFTVDAQSAYTSLGDCCLNNFIELLNNANEIFYVPPSSWSDNKKTSTPFSQGWLTELYLNVAKNTNQISVHGLETVLPDYIHQPINKKSNQQQVWVIGCSTSRGSGVEHNETYGQLVSKELNLPITNLAQSGASNLYQAQLLCQSQIEKDDIVIFGLTSKNRIHHIIKGKGHNVTANHYPMHPELQKILPLEYFDHEQRIFESIYAIQMVQNFCNQIGAKLIMIGIHVDLDISSMISYYKNYIMWHGLTGLDWSDSFLDFGSDGLHPGPKTHQHYAKLILQKIDSLNYINGEKHGTLS